MLGGLSNHDRKVEGFFGHFCILLILLDTIFSNNFFFAPKFPVCENSFAFKHCCRLSCILNKEGKLICTVYDIPTSLLLPFAGYFVGLYPSLLQIMHEHVVKHCSSSSSTARRCQSHTNQRSPLGQLNTNVHVPIYDVLIFTAYLTTENRLVLLNFVSVVRDETLLSPKNG